MTPIPRCQLYIIFRWKDTCLLEKYIPQQITLTINCLRWCLVIESGNDHCCHSNIKHDWLSVQGCDSGFGIGKMERLAFRWKERPADPKPSNTNRLCVDRLTQTGLCRVARVNWLNMTTVVLDVQSFTAWHWCWRHQICRAQYSTLNQIYLLKNCFRISRPQDHVDHQYRMSFGQLPPSWQLPEATSSSFASLSCGCTSFAAI